MASTRAPSTASLLTLSLIVLLTAAPEGAASESLTLAALRQLLPLGSSAPGGVGSAVWLPVPGNGPAEVLLQPASIRSPYLRSVLVDGESAPAEGTVALWQTLAIVQGVVGQSNPWRRPGGGGVGRKKRERLGHIEHTRILLLPSLSPQPYDADAHNHTSNILTPTLSPAPLFLFLFPPRSLQSLLSCSLTLFLLSLLFIVQHTPLFTTAHTLSVCLSIHNTRTKLTLTISPLLSRLSHLVHFY